MIGRNIGLLSAATGMAAASLGTTVAAPNVDVVRRRQQALAGINHWTGKPHEHRAERARRKRQAAR